MIVIKGPHKHILDNLNLQNKTILDAATGVGNTTELLAKRAKTEGGDTRIISVDIEQPQDLLREIRDRLGNAYELVDFREINIFDLDCFEDESMDAVVSDQTIIFLNTRPQKLLEALKHFHRILKINGTLALNSEMPPATDQQTHLWRWSLSKAIWALEGQTWSNEPHPQEVSRALEIVGFELQDQKIFSPTRVHDYENIMGEWEEIMYKKIKNLSWPKLKAPLKEAVKEVWRQVNKAGYLEIPAQYSIIARKN